MGNSGTGFDKNRFSGWIYFLVFVLFPTALFAQSADRVLDLRAYGFDIPPGKVSPASQPRVTTLDEQGRAVVARVQVNVGNYHLVILPNGQLVARLFSAAQPTERPFVAAQSEQMIADLRRGPLANFKTRITRHYVFLYDTSEDFAVATSRILEQMLPGVTGYARLRGVEVQTPEIPLVVIMFPNDDQFQQYRRMPAGIIAYYHTLTNHVVLYEESKLAGVQKELARQQTINTIAHEGVHQILHNNGFQRRMSAWPMWITEGLAEYMSPTSLGERSRWKGVGQVNDLRMYELENFIKSRAGGDSAGEWVDKTVTAARLTSAGYASAWGLTHYLAKMRRAQFNAYLQDLHKLGPLEGDFRVAADGTVAQHLVLFRKHFRTDSAELEQRLATYLKKLPYKAPFANLPHFIVTIAYNDGQRIHKQANVFHTPQLAEKWRDGVIKSIRGANVGNTRAEIRKFPNRLQAEQFIRRWLSVR